MTSHSHTKEIFNIGIFLYERVEDLDFCGPLEVLQIAASVRGQREQKPDWHVFTVAEEPHLLKTSGELLIQPTYSFQDHPPIDLLLFPGGAVDFQLEKSTVIEWVRKVTQNTQLNTSVCNGAFLLGEAGLLDGHTATSHWSEIDRLAERYPKTTVRRDVRWVDEGNLVTSAGISAGIDMSLHLVERLAGRELAEKIARYMEYRWDEQ